MTTRVKRTPKQLVDFQESVKDDTHPNELIDADDMQDDWLEDDLKRHPQEDLLDVTAGDVSAHPFHIDHPLWETHYVRCDRSNLETTVPNFVGGALPRMDQGDREYYCCTMLTLFKPWRDPMHLKNTCASWHDEFTEHAFSDKANTLMKHFNIRYECNDARDDYSSLDRQKRRAMPWVDGQGSRGEEGLDYEGEYGELGEFIEEDAAATFVKGPMQLAKEKLMMEAESVLRASGWTTQTKSAPALFERFVPKQHLSANQWKARISSIREGLFASKFKNAPDTERPTRPSDEPAVGFDVKLLKASYFTKQYKAANEKAQREINTIATTFNLNAEQERAFRLVANHATDLAAAPLRMYLGGVGGTGKSQVIKANFLKSGPSPIDS